MAVNDATIPSRTVGLPMREVCVVVSDGPDAGIRASAQNETITIGSADDNTLVLHDRTVSKYHAEIRRDRDRIRLTDLGSTNGTQIGQVTVREAYVTVTPGAKIALGNSEITASDGETVVVQAAVWREVGSIVGCSDPMQRLMNTVVHLSQKNIPVLLLGESGTGKELVARALHDLGPRASEPFVVIECGAIPPNLFSSELFGHERGAFTGATQTYVGAFERANGGTVFLDEIGELPAEQQVTLLGVLERRRLRRVGGGEDISIDVRIVSATNRDLRSEVNHGTFRLDLYYRIAVVLTSVPALRERPDDIPLLIEHFLRDEGFAGPVEEIFPAEALSLLAAHRWPGNVRELRNIVLAALATGKPELQDGPAGYEIPARENLIDGVVELPYKRAKRVVTDAFELQYLTRLLERSGGNIRGAARLAQIDRTHLSNLIKRHGLR